MALSRTSTLPTSLAALALLAATRAGAQQEAQPAAPGQPPPAATAPDAAPPAAAPQPPPPPAKEVKRWRVSAMVGAGSAYGQSYFLVGANLGYEIAFGLVMNVDGQWWTGQSPSLGKVAPGLTWYAPIPLRPYVGAYYGHWFVSSGLSDQNAIGARAGLALTSAGPAVVGFGVAYEHFLSCSTDCDSWWPEVSAGVAF